MSRKLPFIGRIFWKVLAVVIVLVLATWWLVIRFGGYKMQSQDYGGTIICTVLLSYLVHLWLLPVEEPPPTDDSRESPAPDRQSRSED